MTGLINDVAKTKASASNKVKKHQEFYKPYFKSVTANVTKITPLMKQRDSNLKGYSYYIQVHGKDRVK
jgi:hypothetical protein